MSLNGFAWWRCPIEYVIGQAKGGVGDSSPQVRTSFYASRRVEPTKPLRNSFTLAGTRTW